MKTLLFPLLLLSVTLTAQEKEKSEPFFKKRDTTKKYNKEQIAGISGSDADKKQKDLYKILAVKPKDTALYAALKEQKKDHSKFKILNPTTPEKIKLNTDKATAPSK